MKKILLPILFLFLGFVNYTQAQTTSVAPSTSSSSSTKFEKSDKFEYYLTDLNTTADATTVENIFKSRPGILDATINITTHKIVIFTEQGMPETDIKEVIKFAGKKIITQQEIPKYYR